MGTTHKCLLAWNLAWSCGRKGQSIFVRIPHLSSVAKGKKALCNMRLLYASPSVGHPQKKLSMTMRKCENSNIRNLRLPPLDTASKAKDRWEMLISFLAFLVCLRQVQERFCMMIKSEQLMVAILQNSNSNGFYMCVLITESFVVLSFVCSNCDDGCLLTQRFKERVRCYHQWLSTSSSTF